MMIDAGAPRPRSVHVEIQTCHQSATVSESGSPIEDVKPQVPKDERDEDGDSEADLRAIRVGQSVSSLGPALPEYTH